MKTKNDIAAAMFVILTALRDSKTSMLGGTPNGHLYAVLMEMWNIEDWNILISGMEKAGSITQQNFLLKITPKGEDLQSKLEEIYSKVKQQEAK